MDHKDDTNILVKLNNFSINHKRAIRNEKKELILNQESLNYAEIVNIYKQKYGYLYTGLEGISNFVCFGNTAYCVHNWNINSLNYREFFNALNLHYDEDLSKKIIISLVTLLKLSLANKGYINTVLYIKYKLKILYPTIFESPLSYFCIFNNSLCSYENSYDGTKYELITKDSYIDNLPNIDYSLKKNLFTLINKGLKAYKINIINTDDMYTKNSLYEIKYSSRRFSFNVIYNVEKDIFDMNVKYRFNTFEKKCLFGEIYKEKNSVPQYAITLIENISNKNIDNIELLSELAAYLLLGKYNNDGILLINCSKESKEDIIKFFNLLVENNIFYLKIKDLRHKDTVNKLINSELNGFNGIVITDIKDYEKLENEKLLKKLINGSSISINSISGKNYYKNKLPIIYFATNARELLSIKNNFKCKIYNLKNLNHPVDFNILDNIDIDWIKIIFPLLGVRNIALKKNSSSKNIQATSDDNSKSNDIKYFIKEFCINKKDSSCYAIDLYNSYLDYYKSSFDSECLSYIMFNKQIKKMAKYEYYRPHVSRSEPNRYAFKGIIVNNEKLNDYCKSQATQKYYSSVEEYLKKINYLHPGFNNKDYLNHPTARLYRKTN